MNCKDCSYKEFHDGNGRPGRYYCLHDEARYKNKLGEVVDAFELCADFMEIGAECRGVPDWGITAYDEEKIYFGATGLEIDNITLRYRKSIPVFED